MWRYTTIGMASRVGGAGDLAVDIVAYGRANNLIVVQCKKYAPENKIGSPEIQKFIGMMHVHHQTQSGIFVTTSTFTQPAIELAERHNILLIDGERLVTIMRSRLARSH
jgi:restriction system protein